MEINHLAKRTYKFQNKPWFEERLCEAIKVAVSWLKNNLQQAESSSEKRN